MGRNLIQPNSNLSVVFNKFSIVTGDAQGASEVSTDFRLRPFYNHMGHRSLDVGAILVNIKALKVNLLTNTESSQKFGLENIFCCQV